jgi:large subunit ribosomal protein L23
VRTANYQGKWRRVGQAYGRKPAYKKAVVRLAEGNAIDVYEGI